MERNPEEIKRAVKERYGNLAKQRGQSCCSPGASSSCCGPNAALESAPAAATRLYSEEELETLPEEVTSMSLGCGNPTALAELNEGEVVLDLGSGGGIDCFLAAQKVGARGRAIGLDMTPEMIQLARENAKKMGVSNVEFRLGEMEHMPVSDNSVNTIISNCVINLSPDKDAVFREAFRVLKPGGKFCVSDIVLLEELPRPVQESLEQWAGCVAGALKQDAYLDKIKAAGFARISTVSNPISLGDESDIPQELRDFATALKGKIASVTVKAFKPKA